MANFKIKTKGAPPAPLVRPRPTEASSFVAFTAEADGFSAYVHRDVLDFIADEARRAGPNEIIGLLAGRICQDLERVPYTLVMAAEGATGDEADAGPGHVHISPEGRARVRRRLEDLHPDREIVGWYHSHPHNEARFSSVDAREQSTWRDPNQIGIVYSGTRRDEPFGVYRGPQAVLLKRRPAETASQQTPAAAQLPAPQPGGLKPGLRSVEPGRREQTWPRPARRGDARGRWPRSGLISASRLAAALAVIVLLIGVVWLHARVNAVESALSARQGQSAEAATAATAATSTPAPVQEERSSPPASQATAAETPSASALSEEPPVRLAAKPLLPGRKRAAANSTRAKDQPRKKSGKAGGAANANRQTTNAQSGGAAGAPTRPRTTNSPSRRTNPTTRPTNSPPPAPQPSPPI